MVNYHLQYFLKEDSRLFFVGDVHGRFTELKSLLKKIHFNFEVDVMVFTGDLFDRGNENFELFEFLYPELVKENSSILDGEHKAFYSTWGNHEELILGSLGGDLRLLDIWLRNGGMWFGDLDEKQGKEFEEGIIELSKHLPIILTLTYHEKQYGVSHAEVPCNDWSIFINGYKYRYDALWGRDNIQYQRDFKIVKNIEKTFHGHSPYQYYSNKPIVIGNQHWIDGGDLCLICREVKPSGALVKWSMV